MQSGFLLIDKPIDWTSHDVVGYLRGVLGIKKIGHAGTLDPFATGLLIVGISREATKRIDEFKALPKTYISTIKLGEISTTYDPEGEITVYPPLPRGGARRAKGLNVKKEEIEKILKTFIGKQKQLPPMYSAKKVGGKKLYELARKGIEIERTPHEIKIFDIKLLDFNYPDLKIEVSCSTGTYIRTLAHDIGEALGVGAYCTELERTAIGEYSVEDATAPKEVTKENFQDIFFEPQT